MSQTETEDGQFFSKMVSQLEEWTREGQSERVRKTLMDLNVPKIPREHRGVLANLSNRNSLFMLALKILLPVVRAKKPIFPPASLRERLNFCNALNWVGATREASQRLAKLDPEEDPDVLIYLSFTYFSRWDYQGAIPLLERFVKSEKPPAYRKMVGKINLAAAYIFVNRISEANEILEHLIHETKENNYSLLHGNTHELAAQAAILAGEYGRAENHLESAEKEISSKSNIYSFFIRKWRSIIELKTHQGVESKSLSIYGIRSEAASLKHWETIRDCDFYLALKFKNDELFRKVYFGTPWEPYCKKMGDLYSHHAEKHSEYLWCAPDLDETETATSLAPKQSTEDMWSGGTLDLKLGVMEGVPGVSGRVFQSGTLTHKLAQILCGDFYRPFRVGDLSASLFPDEFFHPEHSAKKIFNLVGRFRKSVENQNLPMKIKVKDGEYMLQLERELRVRIPLRWTLDEKWKVELERLRLKWPYKSFSSSELQIFLECSPPTGRKLLQKGLQAGLIIATGKGRGKVFRFSN